VTVGHTITWLSDALAHSLAAPGAGHGKAAPKGRGRS
jgi:hypothetical protein